MTYEEKRADLIAQVKDWRRDCDQMIAALEREDYDQAYDAGASLSYANINGSEQTIQELQEEAGA